MIEGGRVGAAADASDFGQGELTQGTRTGLRTDCQIRCDLVFARARETIKTRVDPQTLIDRILGTHRMVVGRFNPLLIRGGSAVVLVDTGIGRFAPAAGAGRLRRLLAAEGLEPSEVDHVVVSHAHPDHLGGLIVEGAPGFPQARHFILAAEWEFWDSASPELVPEALAVGFEEALRPLRRLGRLELVEDGSDVAPGVRLDGRDAEELRATPVRQERNRRPSYQSNRRHGFRLFEPYDRILVAGEDSAASRRKTSQVLCPPSSPFLQRLWSGDPEVRGFLGRRSGPAEPVTALLGSTSRPEAERFRTRRAGKAAGD